MSTSPPRPAPATVEVTSAPASSVTVPAASITIAPPAPADVFAAVRLDPETFTSPAATRSVPAPTVTADGAAVSGSAAIATSPKLENADTFAASAATEVASSVTSPAELTLTTFTRPPGAT